MNSNPTMTPVVFDGCFGWLHRPASHDGTAKPEKGRAAGARGATGAAGVAGVVATTRATVATGAAGAPGAAAAASPASPPIVSMMGVILCSPFGYDALCTHRGWRELAEALAASGIPTLRFDYPGAGDSSGNEDDPQRLRAWLDSIKAAAALLQAETGVVRLSFCGLRLGATLAALAAEELGGIDNLVLMAPAVSGKAYVRELSMQHQSWLSTPGGKEGAEPSGAAGTVGAYGFRLYPDTLEPLVALDLEQRARRPAARVLVQDICDGARIRRLVARYCAQGAQAEVQLFPEYGKFLLDPRYSVPPRLAFENVLAWLAQGASVSPSSMTSMTSPASPVSMASMKSPASPLSLASPVSSTSPVSQASPALPALPACMKSPASMTSMSAPEVEVRAAAASARIDFADGDETPVVFGNGRYTGVFCRPQRASGNVPAVLFVNTGGVHRIGDGRLAVLLARRLAAQGIASLRMDLSGLGDSQRRSDALTLDALYAGPAVADAQAGVDWLTAAGHPRTVMFGVCTGAYVSLHTALAHPHVVGCMAVNLPFFAWGGAQTKAGAQHVEANRVYRRSLRDPRKWLRLLTGRTNAYAITIELMRRLAARIGARLSGPLEHLLGWTTPSGAIRQLAADLDRKGVPTLLMYGPLDEGLDELTIHFGPNGQQLAKLKNICVTVAGRVDHALFSPHAREVVMEQFERFLRSQVLREMSMSGAVNSMAGEANTIASHPESDLPGIAGSACAASGGSRR